MKVKDFLTEKNWVNHSPIAEPDKCCLYIALHRCYPDEEGYYLERQRIYRRILAEIDHPEPVNDDPQAIINWNDSQTSFEPVRELITKLDI